MAYFLLNPVLFDLTQIAAKVADSTITTPWIFTTDFSNWNDANQPLGYNVFGGEIAINIPDWNVPVINDYLAKWLYTP
jgi:hypothetical protein